MDKEVSRDGEVHRGESSKSVEISPIRKIDGTFLEERTKYGIIFSLKEYFYWL